ncbi:hypothetical protein [Methylobacterium trifolii]|uniref:hypothetical protein n=1 Tax=Methylobacterium trifolii TaxID=1003092 RepID=UPI001EDD3C59|nr:hypothetical protein [Methylobacterium trifolii]
MTAVMPVVPMTMSTVMMPAAMVVPVPMPPVMTSPVTSVTHFDKVALRHRGETNGSWYGQRRGTLGHAHEQTADKYEGKEQLLDHAHLLRSRLSGKRQGGREGCGAC